MIGALHGLYESFARPTPPTMGSAESETLDSRSASTVLVETAGNLVSVATVAIDGSYSSRPPALSTTKRSAGRSPMIGAEKNDPTVWTASRRAGSSMGCAACWASVHGSRRTAILLVWKIRALCPICAAVEPFNLLADFWCYTDTMKGGPLMRYSG
jgi:hypothetical protein